MGTAETPTVIPCKRCKKEFVPKKQELRCSDCLRRRKSDRATRREDSRTQTEVTKAVEKMMRGNGQRKHRSNATLLG